MIKFILFLLFTTLVLSIGIKGINKGNYEKHFKNSIKYSKLSKSEKETFLKGLNIKRLNITNKQNSLNSITSTSNVCSSVPVITQCLVDEHGFPFTAQQKRVCLVDKAYVCNQFKKQPVGFVFNNNVLTAFLNNQISSIMINDSTANNINVDNAGFYQSYDLITYIIDVIQPQTYVRLFPLTLNTEDVEYKVKNEYGVEITRIKRVLRQTFIAQTCSNGVYTTTCSSGVEEISIVMFINEIFFSDDYSSINMIYCQEIDYIPDPQKSAALVSLSDDDLITQTISLICNTAQKNILSQYDWNIRSNKDSNQINQLCGSTTGITGTFGINRVGSNGFTLGAQVF